MKLSPKQKEVIRKMREGAHAETSIYYDFSATIIINGESKKLHYLTFLKLIKNNLISVSSHYSTGKIYHLTELGKTIEL